jgi:SEL1 protein
MLYYTFAALGGAAEAEMTVGYRHWVGIATKQSCADALPFYKSAADKGRPCLRLVLDFDRSPSHG